ncbi:protein FMP32, mitochondrial [Capsicum annuum]|uniref:protein FMP32, mitochondrial n=1 Tax=Capsicum annuum TaxID=4072 RepID=UPI0007BF14AB|nr:protein FMP32, mitochondrial [Capsicum annuum]
MAVVVVKRVIPLVVNYGISLSKLQGINNVAINTPAAASLLVNNQCRSKSSAHNKFDYRQISQLVKPDSKRAFLVDTLALVRRLEAQGVPSKHAEAITAAITEVLNNSLDNIAHSFVSLAEMQKCDLVQEANLSKFKSQVQSSQENHFTLLQQETEKLRNDIEKVRVELRYEIDKLTAGQRLDLNLERGIIRDELAKQNTGTTDLTNKLDREIHTLRAQLEAGKYEVIKYCIGTLVSISAVGLAVLRLYA